ncbi:uncharacterized protein A4U43_C02F8960 [Asparagus officinalis]|uniref:BHLH domain-containing protein n=1 Tax=Asparagus officinalis TaxID=4686 RepID=A0A5P1FHV5_ASPOF|nr:transcription factor FAMA [Asparagus officinalis]ONK77644.1 uncharacterized protein A4U43_C02F8960 [Asparagus officinalis]
MDKELQESYSDFVHQAQAPESSVEMVDYMLSNHPPPPQHQISLDRLSFADIMQFADFGPKLGLNQSKNLSEDDNYLLRSFNLMNEKQTHGEEGPSMINSLPPPQPQMLLQDEEEEEEGRRLSEMQEQLGFSGGQKIGGNNLEVKNKRKRARAMKTSEEVESQRMTHIAVERNRRRQMNEHLRVLRSLMPGSYVQRGDQASIIGGAIEFVRELEQLLQCLESQKRRRFFGGNEPPRNPAEAPPLLPPPSQPFFPPLALPCSDNDTMRILDLDPNLQEDMAENKSVLANIEVRVLGFDALIKILSRRRPQQLIKTIAALEDMQFSILHTNITTIEQTVLYSFNVKITGETSCSAEDIVNSVHQILSFIDTSTI